MEKYCTANEAAALLGLKYHTFLSRVRKGEYTREYFGKCLLFDRELILKEDRERNQQEA